MALFDWNEDYAIGVETMDRDHRQVLHLTSELQRALRDGAPLRELLEKFDHAFGALQVSMEHEENVLKEAGYPAYRFHKREHDDLVHILHEYRSKAADGTAAFCLSAVEFLGGWLISHFRGEDRCAGSFLSRLAKAS